MKLGMQVGLGPSHIVLDDDPAPLTKRGRSTQFSTHVCCGQMAAWIKMPLRMQVKLGDHDIPLTGSNIGNLTAFRANFSHIFTTHAQERPFMKFQLKF